tara:strand:+ start:1248 stop:1928 length:681 start_codon:yes stop_codon:yes gene_type:complete
MGGLAFVISVILYLMYTVILPAGLQSSVKSLENQNQALVNENLQLKNKNDELLLENGSKQQNLEAELIKVAELQAQANIVEKIKKESLEEIAKYNDKLSAQNKQIEFYQELMSPSVEQELQCFNINAKHGKKYVDYGLNLVLDKKNETGKGYDVEFRLLSGKNNVELTETMPETLAPDAIRNITLKNSIRLTGKIKHNNKLNGLKVLDVRVLNKSKKLVAQCWKVF